MLEIFNGMMDIWAHIGLERFHSRDRIKSYIEGMVLWMSWWDGYSSGERNAWEKTWFTEWQVNLYSYKYLTY